MFRMISKLIMKWWGWKYDIDLIEWPKKYIVAVVPHTSSWDFPLGIFTRSIFGQDIKFIGKKSLFPPVLGAIMKAMGGYPVDRSKSNNFVQAVVDVFDSKDEFKIAIAPEGTRDAVKHLKTGFYFIAKGANIPILLCRFDWGNKIISFSKPFYPTADQSADFEYIENHFRGVKGYHHTKSFI